MSDELNGQLDGDVRRWKQYPGYTAPGSQWIAELPSHWQLKRLKHVASIQTGLTLGKDYAGRQLVARPYLRVANVQDGYLDLDKITQVSVPAEDVNRHELRPGDVLMTEGGDFDKLGRGHVWEGQIEGCLHQNHIFAVRPNRQVLEPHFLAALMTSAHGKNYFTSTSQQTTNLASTNSTKLKNFPLPTPCVEEQRAILAFLNRETAKIAALVAKKERLIELLQEKRTALISHAVTKGLESSVPMKDSRVAWLGQIPSHWELKPLCRVVNVVGGMTPSKDEKSFWDGDVPWVSPKDMKRHLLADSEDHITDQALSATRIAMIPPRAVLIVVRGMILARDFPVAVNTVPVTVNQDMKALIPNSTINAEFLAHQLRAIKDAFFAVVEESGHGTKCLRTEVWKPVRVAVPPMNEQHAICSHLAVEADRIDRLIAKTQQGIDKLREYRTALISAAVTGRIDVRQEGEP